jgi:hypothetical protein
MPEYTVQNFTIKGRQVPIPVTKVGTTAVRFDGKLQYEDIVPNYARWLSGLGSQTGPTRAQIGKSLQALEHEAWRYLNRASGFVYRTHRGPILVTSDLDPATYWIDQHGCVWLNEAWAEDRAWDSDGDGGDCILSKSGATSTVSKSPIHKPVAVCRRAKEAPVPDFYNFRWEAWLQDNPWKPPTEEEIWDKFRSSHAIAKIGPITNFFNYREVKATQGWPYMDRIEYFCKDLARFDMLETKGMKTFRKGGASAELPPRRPIAKAHTAWIMGIEPDQSSPRDPSADAKRQQYLDTLDMETAVKQIRTLSGVEFKTIKSRKKDAEVVSKVPPRPKDPQGNVLAGNKVVESLKAFGCIVITEMPHAGGDFFPPVKTIRLMGPTWNHRLRRFEMKPVALEETKRGGELTYSVAIPPICMLQGENPCWVDVEDLLERYIHKALVLSSKGHNRARYWSFTLNDLFDFKKKRHKVAMIQDVIQKIVCQYGVSSVTQRKFPDEIVPDQSNPLVSPIRNEVARHCVTVEYETVTTSAMEKKLKTIDRWVQQSGLRLSVPGGDKQSDRPFRTYMVGDIQTCTPILTNRTCDAKRMSEIKKQLAMSFPLHSYVKDEVGEVVRKPDGNPKVVPVRSNLFIFSSTGARGEQGCKVQLFATTAGVNQQRCDSFFLERASSTPSDETTRVVEHGTFDGRSRVWWISEPQPVITVGKLLTKYATKNMVADLGHDIHTTDGDEVHFLLSAEELEGKGALHAILEECNPKTATIQWKGRNVQGVLVDIQFFRSTNPSENVKPGRRLLRTRGMEHHFVFRAVLEANLSGCMVRRRIDWDYLEVLQNAIRTLRAICLGKDPDKYAEQCREKALQHRKDTETKYPEVNNVRVKPLAEDLTEMEEVSAQIAAWLDEAPKAFGDDADDPESVPEPIGQN